GAFFAVDFFAVELCELADFRLEPPAFLAADEPDVDEVPPEDRDEDRFDELLCFDELVFFAGLELSLLLRPLPDEADFSPLWRPDLRVTLPLWISPVQPSTSSCLSSVCVLTWRR